MTRSELCEPRTNPVYFELKSRIVVTAAYEMGSDNVKRHLPHNHTSDQPEMNYVYVYRSPQAGSTGQNEGIPADIQAPSLSNVPTKQPMISP